MRSARGRPPAVSADDVALVALRLFERRGFDAVTMDEIATAAGISRRTLFRLFPSKNDLVWGGAREAIERLATALEAVPPAQGSLAQLIEHVESATLGPLADAQLLEATRRRLRLIGSVPALVAHGAPWLDTGRDLLARFISRRGHTAAPAALLAQAAVSGLFAALLWWAEHGDGPPLEMVQAVLHDLGRSTAEPAA